GTYFFTQDQINSTALVTDAQGAKFARVYYKPFGEIYMLEGTNGFRAKFTGQELDEESGLYYYNARYYDPRLGRFISPDVFTLGGPDVAPASLNQYAYAGNNPVLYTDPSGHIFGIDDAVIFIVITAVSVAAGTYFGGAAVNHSMNPAKWDWTAPKTYVGMAAGAAVAFAGAEIGAGVAGALGGGVAGNVIGGALSGAFENAAYSALGGGSPEQIAEQALTGALLGAAFAGAAAGASRGLSRFGRAATESVADETATAARQGKSVGAKPIIEEATTGASECMCFNAGTEVLTAKGPAAIQDLQLGDEVLAYDEAAGRVEPHRVVALFTRNAGEEVLVGAGGEVIRTTPEHRFWVEGEGWVEAASLRRGDVLVSAGGEPVEVSGVGRRPAGRLVYNFEVETAHTYFVSRAGVLVHNQCKLLGFMKTAWQQGGKKAVQEWSDQSVTLYRGTSYAAESQEILSGQLVSKAQRAGVSPGFFNRSLIARIWHSVTSDIPKSQYVSTTSSKTIARDFADANVGKGNGFVHGFEMRRGDVYRAYWNPWEAEYLAPGGTKINNPRIEK
ncbi:MAG TPA: RHS repeat-associated core domain-containing protein, partial [Pyrinomonadaceae bacterium]